MKMNISLPKKLILTALVFFVLFAFSLGLFFYFQGSGAYGGVFHPSNMEFFLFDQSAKVYFSCDRAEDIIGTEKLFLENKEKETLSFVFYQEGAKKGTLTLQGNTKKEIPFPLNAGKISLLVQKGEASFAYLTDRASFLSVSREMKEGGEMVFLAPVSLGKLSLVSPFRLFGDFTFDEISIETEKKGKIAVSPKEETEGDLFVSAPKADLYFQNLKLKYQKEQYSFCFQVKGVNGKRVAENKFPISSFEDLARLSEPDLLPKAKEGAEISFIKEITLKESLSFSKIVALSFEKKVNFGKHTLSFASAEKGTYRVNCAAGVTVFSGDLLFSAPKATLLWQGDSVPYFHTIEKQNNVKEYNNTPLNLGGEGSALPNLTLLSEGTDFLSKDLDFSLKGNLLSATLPFSVSEKDLDSAFFSLSCEKGEATLEGTLSEGVITTRDQEGKERRFAVTLEREKKNIPVVYIETENGAPVESKTQYISATFSLEGIDSVPTQKETGIRIRGRGNSTWKWEKKPYKIHFDTPTSLLGLPEAEEWALFANYADKSLMRNKLAQEMASVLSFDYCPSQTYVDLFVNGEYQGVYTLGEHLEAGAGRVEVKYNSQKTDCGFFLEAGGTTSGVDVKGLSYFHADLVKFIAIKSPDYTTLTSEQFNFIKDYMMKANNAVKSGEGYEEYLDLETLVDWMIMIELSCNTDCSWRRSTFFTKNPGEKLKMGPVWDFDLAFGNFSKDNDGYDTFVSTEPDDDYIGETWSTYLLEDPEFRALFKARWQEKKHQLLGAAFEMIEEDSKLLIPSAEENFAKWDILGKKVAFERHDTVLYTTYHSQIQYLQDFLLNRAAWLDMQVENW